MVSSGPGFRIETSGGIWGELIVLCAAGNGDMTGSRKSLLVFKAGLREGYRAGRTGEGPAVQGDEARGRSLCLGMRRTRYPGAS